MSDLESRVYGLEADLYATRENVASIISELSTKANVWDFEELKANYLARISFLETQYEKLMKFLDQNWGITNVDDLI